MTWLANRPRPTPRIVAAVAAAVVVAIGVGAVMQGALNSPGPSPGQSPGSTSVSPGASPGGQWGALDLVPLQAVASLEPTNQDDAGVASDSAFILKSLGGEAAGSLAARLEVSPKADLAISPESDAGATVKPTKPLTPGQTYRFALRTADGALAGSWAFPVRGPVHVLSTIPGNATNGVPVRTGVEVSFNQDGVAAMDDHFSISPATAGRFERHGRTQVFVPDAGLKAATLYSVTVKAGLARTGTDLALPADVVFRFETQGQAVNETRLRFGREAIEASPTERPVVALRAIFADTDESPPDIPSEAAVRVYRFPSLDAASSALSAFLAAPRWADFADPLMPTDGLPVAATFSAPLEPIGEDLVILRFPDRLATGIYIVEIQGSRRAQAFLQVTPVSAWVTSLSDRTVVWVNDVATGKALPNATVALGDAAPFGRSNADGLAIAPTPAGLIPPAAATEQSASLESPVLTIASGADRLLVPFGLGSDGGLYRGEWWEKTAPADERYWAALSTDRAVYRTDDRIQLAGYLRGRDDDRVPPSVEIRLVSASGGDLEGRPAVVSATATPGASGAFTAELRLAAVPIGPYQAQAVVDGRVVVARWLDVSVIRKPAYQLDLVPDRRAVLAGMTVNWTATASFFDGSPVPFLDLRVTGIDQDEGRDIKTDAAGRATLRLNARLTAPPDETWEDVLGWYMETSPAGPEAAEILGAGSVMVFPSAYDLRASGVVADGRLRVTGSLRQVDLARVDRELADATWDGNAAGAAVANRTVTAQVTELIPVRRQVGSQYDFVEKVSRPIYEYDVQRKAVRQVTVRSAADGRIAIDTAVPDPAHEYEVVLQAIDGSDRVQRRTITAGQPVVPWTANAGVVFENANGQSVESSPYGIGDAVVWRMVDDGLPFPSGGTDRYLYLVAQRGLRSATVTDEATFRHTYAAADAPGIFVIGVRFTGSTYAPKAAGWANFDSAERSIKVSLAAARERYRPGEDVAISVRTTHPDGKPVSATVVLQAVDQKLFAIGGAVVPQPLDELYQRVDSGIVRLIASHQVPTMSGSEGEGGDTTGGGGRSDFRDTLFFRQLTTDANGRASATVKLSDDLTSWHVVATALTSRLEAGTGDMLVPVGLPFFVEATIADEYLATDKPTIQLRTFGDAIQAGDPVELTIQSPSLGMAGAKVQAVAFATVGVQLPALSAGDRSIDITAVATTRKDSAGKALTDRLVRTFRVVPSRLTATHVDYRALSAGLPGVPADAGLATYTFSDAGRGRFLPVLLDLVEPSGSRLDRGVAQAIARGLLVADFGRDGAALPPTTFDASRYDVGATEPDDATKPQAGVALLPYGGLDPWLAARVAILAPQSLDGPRLHEALEATRSDPTTQADLGVATLAGLAAMGDPVLDELREARRAGNLGPMAQIYLALGFAAVGDDTTALDIERTLLEDDGERLGQWVRLRMGGDAAASLEASALMAALAAGLGDPVADGLAAHVLASGGTSQFSLELAAYAARGLERTPASPASFSWTVAGERTVVLLEPGDAVTLPLTAEQRSTLSAEGISGQVAVAVESRVTVDPGSLRPHAGLTLKRITPPNPIPTDRIVGVDLTATFAEGLPENGCYDVVEQVPSGLAPLAVGRGEIDETGVVTPSSVVGQAVTFCAANDARSGHTSRMRYLARVVNPGTFAWEPAVMQLVGAPEALALTPATAATIGGP